VDAWLIGGGGCIELNPNPPVLRPRHGPWALIADGDDEKEGMTECEKGEVRQCGGKYGGCRWGLDPCPSRV
jgi:hypothetical protein